jgi:sialate O-acetylesterase
LALAARAITYGEKIEWSGPLDRQVTSEEHGLRVWFDHADGLMAKGEALTGFEIAGADGKYSPADGRIEGSSVVVSSAAVPTPISVRYGWAANPNCNLFNKQGLPASPFQAPE